MVIVSRLTPECPMRLRVEWLLLSLGPSAVSLDFHTVSIWAVEAALKAAYQAGRKSTKSDDIDIDAILAKRKQIAILWDAVDVKEMCPDLTDEQAWEVLKHTRHQHDATLGICWETLEFTAQTLFGDAPESDEA